MYTIETLNISMQCYSQPSIFSKNHPLDNLICGHLSQTRLPKSKKVQLNKSGKNMKPCRDRPSNFESSHGLTYMSTGMEKGDFYLTIRLQSRVFYEQVVNFYNHQSYTTQLAILEKKMNTINCAVV